MPSIICCSRGCSSLLTTGISRGNSLCTGLFIVTGLPLLLITLTTAVLTRLSVPRINCSTHPSFHWLRGRLSSKTVTISPSDTAILDLGLDFCQCRFLNSVTYSLLQRLQKCSSSNPKYFRLLGRSSDDTVWSSEAFWFPVTSGSDNTVFVFHTSSDLVSMVLQDHLTIRNLRV